MLRRPCTLPGVHTGRVETQALCNPPRMDRGHVPIIALQRNGTWPLATVFSCGPWPQLFFPACQSWSRGEESDYIDPQESCQTPWEIFLAILVNPVAATPSGPRISTRHQPSYRLAVIRQGAIFYRVFQSSGAPVSLAFATGYDGQTGLFSAKKRLRLSRNGHGVSLLRDRQTTRQRPANSRGYERTG